MQSVKEKAVYPLRASGFTIDKPPTNKTIQGGWSTVIETLMTELMSGKLLLVLTTAGEDAAFEIWRLPPDSNDSVCKKILGQALKPCMKSCDAPRLTLSSLSSVIVTLSSGRTGRRRYVEARTTKSLREQTLLVLYVQ